MTATAKDHGFSCSFCGQEQRRARHLISGPGVFICPDCVGLCVDILQEIKALPPRHDLVELAQRQQAEIWRLRSIFEDVIRTASAARDSIKEKPAVTVSGDGEET